ncbi:unnamed protein product [Rhizophagus irregularis]|nr:unnamed protein product [Rhizophagus irregularis]
MSVVTKNHQHQLIFTTINEIHESSEYKNNNNIKNNFNLQHEIRKEMIIANKNLTKDQKSQMIKLLIKSHDHNKIIFNEGIKRICENCQEECLATLYCEYCIRNYLETKFSNWTSENNDVDDLIQKCQIESISPNKIIEWIPYDNLQNVKLLTGGIYSADWVTGYYEIWDSKKRQLERSRTKKVILKRLENVENANKSWFEEAKSCFNTSNKWNSLVKYYGLTKDQSGYMLVMKELDMNLRNYLQSHKLTWKEVIKITQDIICALLRIHEENIIHKNLHSRNILFLKYKDQWQIGDLGFCGPADKSLGNIYGTLPYLAPEVITEREHNFSSDIYSLGMLMWEISSRYPPFANYEHDDCNFINDIINGMRPEIIPDKINEMMNKVQQTADDYTNIKLMNDCSVNSINRSFNSKVHDVVDLCEQRNIIKGKAYPSIQVYSSIPNNIVTENRIGQFDSPILIDDDDDDDEINKPKRMYWEILDGNEDDDVIIIKHKKIKLNN